MPKIAAPLGPLDVKRLSAPGLHFAGTVPGLALRIAETGARSWLLRVVVAGKRRDMTLGQYPGVALAQAIELARAARAGIAAGRDPIKERAAARRELAAQQARAVTFGQVAADYIEAHAPSWRNDKHAAQWRSTLDRHAAALLPLPVASITAADVLGVLSPIWSSRPETASRLRGRIEAVLDAATVRGARDGPNPARWRGHLAHTLPRRGPAQHHPALQIDALPPFMAALALAPGMGAAALRFLILTATRSGDVRGATWAEVDTASAVWCIPAKRTKAGREHRVPLAVEALALLAALPPGEPDAYLFPGARGGALSDMTITACMRRLQAPGVPHGMRSTFRDWCAERSHHPREAAEHALAHTVAGKTERAYFRSDLFDRRRTLMADWARFALSGCASGAGAAIANAKAAAEATA